MAVVSDAWFSVLLELVPLELVPLELVLLELVPLELERSKLGWTSAAASGAAVTVSTAAGRRELRAARGAAVAAPLAADRPFRAAPALDWPL